MKLSNHHHPSCCGLHVTPREIEVLVLLCGGQRYSQIAEQLFISPATVAHHIASMQTRLQVVNRPSLVAKALACKLVTGDQWPVRKTGNLCIPAF